MININSKNKEYLEILNKLSNRDNIEYEVVLDK